MCTKELKVELHINYQIFALFFGKAANFWACKSYDQVFSVPFEVNFLVKEEIY